MPEPYWLRDIMGGIAAGAGDGIGQRDSSSSWKDFLMGLKKRGLADVEFAVSAIGEVLSEANNG